MYVFTFIYHFQQSTGISKQHRDTLMPSLFAPFVTFGQANGFEGFNKDICIVNKAL